MKIALLQNVDSMKYRLQHFLNTLQLKNDIVCIKNIDDLNINNFDILLCKYSNLAFQFEFRLRYSFPFSVAIHI